MEGVISSNKTKYCEACKTEISPEKRVDSVYCSVKCRKSAYERRKWQKRGALKARENWKEKTCPNCEKIFLPDIKHKYQKFCSNQCRDAVNNAKKVETGMKKIHAAKYRRLHKGELRKKDNEYKDRTRFPNEEESKSGLNRLALQRDNHTCQRCDEKESLIVHHNRYPAKLEDLITLCRSCHFYIHLKEFGIFIRPYISFHRDTQGAVLIAPTD